MLAKMLIFITYCTIYVCYSCKQNAPSARSSRSTSSYNTKSKSKLKTSSHSSSQKDIKFIAQGTEIAFPEKYKQSFSPNSYIAGYLNLGVTPQGKPLRGLYIRPGGVLEVGPLIIAIHGKNGLDEAFKKLLLRYLSSSTQIFALDLYGKVPSSSEEADSLQKILNDKPASELIAFVQLAMFELRKKSTKLSQFMLMGWAEGGRRAVDLSLTISEVSMVINYYGYPFAINDKPELFKIPMLAYFLQDDSTIPVSRITELENLLADSGNTNFKKVIKPSPTSSGFMDETQGNIYDEILTSEVVEESINVIRSFSVSR